MTKIIRSNPYKFGQQLGKQMQEMNKRILKPIHLEKWSEEELDYLVELIRNYGRNYAKISECLTTRTEL